MRTEYRDFKTVHRESNEIFNRIRILELELKKIKESLDQISINLNDSKIK